MREVIGRFEWSIAGITFVRPEVLERILNSSRYTEKAVSGGTEERPLMTQYVPHAGRTGRRRERNYIVPVVQPVGRQTKVHVQKQI